jgi:type I restriction enzyme S subunit
MGSHGWTKTTIGDVAELATGTTPPSKNPGYFDGEICWYTPQDVVDKLYLGKSARTITQLAKDENKARLFQKGTVLMTAIGNIGRLGILATAASANQQITGIRVNPREIDPEYLFYWLLANREEILSRASQATLPIINQGKIKGIPVAYPALPEQYKIIAHLKQCMECLDEIEGLRDDCLQKREALIESLVEAEMQSADGKPSRLAEVCSITSVLIDPREPEFQKLIHVGGANIESRTGRLIGLQTAAEENLKSGKFVFDISMVLYNKIRPYLMKVARPDFAGLCSADMYPLSPNPTRITRDYLFYVLMSRRFTDYAIAGSNRAGMPKVNRDHLFAYEFPLPLPEVQAQVTEQLDASVATVLDLREQMTSTKVDTVSLRQSVLHKSFAGVL